MKLRRSDILYLRFAMFQVWNIQSNAEFTLSTSAGQVYTMVAANGMLFAGAQVTTNSPLNIH